MSKRIRRTMMTPVLVLLALGVIGVLTMSSAHAAASTPQTPASGTWRLLPNGATDIGIGANGSVWITGTNPVPGGYGIYQWNGSGWVAIPGGAVRIAVDPFGNPWVADNGGFISQYTSQASVVISTPVDGSFHQPGTPITFSAQGYSSSGWPLYRGVTYSWIDIGDGWHVQGQTIVEALMPFCGTPQHVVTVTATFSDGTSATATVSVDTNEGC